MLATYVTRHFIQHDRFEVMCVLQFQSMMIQITGYVAECIGKVRIVAAGQKTWQSICNCFLFIRLDEICGGHIHTISTHTYIHRRQHTCHYNNM